MRSLFLSAVTLALLVACRSTSNEHLRVQARADDDTIAPGDTVTVVDELRPQVIMASARIHADGRMEFPELGLVEVTGFTPRGLREDLGKRYRDVYGDSVVAVDVLPPDRRYYVYGEIARPGRFGLDSGVTAFEAVTRAEPDRNTADLTAVRLVRGEGNDEQVVELNVRRMGKGDLTFNISLQDGDILYVPPTAVGRALSPILPAPKPTEDEVRRLRASDGELDE